MKVFLTILYTMGIAWNSVAQRVIYMRNANTHLPFSATGIVGAFERCDAGPQHHYKVMHNMGDGTKQEWEDYSWFLEGIRNMYRFSRSPLGKWELQMTAFHKDTVQVGLAEDLSIEVCVE